LAGHPVQELRGEEAVVPAHQDVRGQRRLLCERPRCPRGGHRLTARAPHRPTRRQDQPASPAPWISAKVATSAPQSPRIAPVEADFTSLTYLPSTPLVNFGGSGSQPSRRSSISASSTSRSSA